MNPMDSLFLTMSKNLLAKAKKMTVTHSVRTGYSVAVGGFSSVSAVVGEFTGIVDGVDLRSLGDFSNKGFRLGDRKITTSAKGLTFVPAVGDVVTCDSEDWSIIQVQPLNGYQDLVAMELFVRKGVK